MISYANITNASSVGRKGGYKPALYLMPNADVLTWVRPVGSTPGDTVKIKTAHTLVEDKAVIQWAGKLYSATLTSDNVGDPGAREFLHKATIIILGDTAEAYEQFVQALNDDKTVFFKDADCINNGGYIQLGDDCNPCEFAIKFDGKTNSPQGGNKEYTIEITSSVKFFYTAAALPAPEA